MILKMVLMRQKHGKQVITIYQEFFDDVLGIYKISDFTFTFEFDGSDTKADVTIIFKGEEMGSMDMPLEDDEWKMNVREIRQ